ncbi:putative hydrolase [Halopolyspora algeriensis]|uniref:Putative hydrolase n=1 Tax=Halopolyspora algeriensis TaxID=1500506 RepID=A0A368VMB3_9ACTN|nr:zinc-dependent metalloprotease [Halopolyspora algeriensis]RCW42849.1 putative hydrolase [Halopolyspora algeriensis]TQM56681.1 putative hydrolase [Halopolyspora algeriensis]
MSDVPFGFGPHDPNNEDPDDRDKGESSEGRSGSDAGNSGNAGNQIPGFGGMPGPGGMPNFDIGALGQMLTQLGQVLSHSGSGGTGPVNYDLAKQLAVQQLHSNQTTERPTREQVKAIEESVRLAEMWLDPVTSLPVGTHAVQAWSSVDWVEKTLSTWQRLCDPVAQQVSNAWLEAMPEEAKQAAGPLLSMLGQMGGLTFGSQLGNGLAQLGGEVLTSTDVGLPLGPDGTAALLPANVDRFVEGLDRPAGEVTVFLAAREAAHHRLFSHVPWLRQRLLATVEEYAQGIQVDTSSLEDLASRIDPTDPSSMQELMSSGMLEPKTTPEQQAALNRLENLLALVEGWVDVVVTDAVGERLPGAEALGETVRRRRASGGPAEQTFATLVGLELRPRRLRAAATLWRLLTERHGVAGRDQVWDHPDLLPSAEDLDEPLDFADRWGTSTEDLDDPIAAIRRAESREQGTPQEGDTSRDEAGGDDTDGSSESRSDDSDQSGDDEDGGDTR